MDNWERDYGWIRQAAYDADEGRADKHEATIILMSLSGVTVIVFSAVIWALL